MKRTHEARAAAAILLIGLIGRNLSADEAEDKAVAVVKKLGGIINRDDKAEGKPVIIVDLERTKVTDADLKMLAGFKQMRELYLNNTVVTDEGLKTVVAYKQLRFLSLIGTKMTDKGLQELVALKNLEDVCVARTGVTAKGVAEFQKASPKCRVTTD